jgi:hypothetical protein
MKLEKEWIFKKISGSLAVASFITREASVLPKPRNSSAYSPLRVELLARRVASEPEIFLFWFEVLVMPLC